MVIAAAVVIVTLIIVAIILLVNKSKSDELLMIPQAETEQEATEEIIDETADFYEEGNTCYREGATAQAIVIGRQGNWKKYSYISNNQISE